MANEENLKGHGFHERTAKEQREIAKQGGIASGKARREKRLLKDAILEAMGADDWDEIIQGAIDRAKDTDKGFEILRDTIGQKPIEKLAVTNIDQSIEELHGYFERADNKPAEE